MIIKRRIARRIAALEKALASGDGPPRVEDLAAHAAAIEGTPEGRRVLAEAEAKLARWEQEIRHD